MLTKQQDIIEYGIWITNGTINKRLLKDDALPLNYVIGKTDFSMKENI